MDRGKTCIRPGSSKYDPWKNGPPLNRSLSYCYPDISAEWHPTLNGDLTPDKVFAKGGQKVWWICPICNKEYLAAIRNRTDAGSGCPRCSKGALPGQSFADRFPQLLMEWDQEKNCDLNPFEITERSPRKVWWRCKDCGNEWRTSIFQRTVNGNNCRRCYNKRQATPEEGKSLFDVDPILATQWHPSLNGELTPKDVFADSGKNVWWKCENGHEWRARISDQRRNRPCPYCPSQRLTSGYNLKDVFPSIAAEWDIERNSLSPEHVYPFSRMRVYWVCRYGHRWSACIANRTSNGTRCPKCKLALTSEVELKIYEGIKAVVQEAIHKAHPVLGVRLEADIFLPKQKVAIEIDGYRSHQDRQRDEEKNKVFNENGISVVRLRLSLEKLSHLDICEERSSSRLNDEDFKRLVERILGSVSQITGEKYNTSRLKNLNFETNYGAEYRVKNSLAQLDQFLSSEWHPTLNGSLEPVAVYAQSNMKAWWKCKECGHEWETRIQTRFIHKTACPKCAHRMRYGSLESRFPGIAAQWHPTLNETLTPDQVHPTDKLKVYWICHKGHIWRTRILQRVYRKTGCPVCNHSRKKD